MDFGIYLRECLVIPEKIAQSAIHLVVCGDYGCVDIIPSAQAIIAFQKQLALYHLKLHYISPKVSQAVLDQEYSRVIRLMDAGIAVSINDWGLLYQLKPAIGPENAVYLGRLLTKSIYNWAWSAITLAREKVSAREYLVQNNFNQRQKLVYFKQWRIKGIEGNAYPEGEAGYRRIKASGFEIIGFADNPLLALARACPTARLNGADLSTHSCPGFCRTQPITIVPADDKQKAIYPPMELRGNTLYKPEDFAVSWSGYAKLVFNWRTGREGQILDRINSIHSVPAKLGGKILDETGGD
jgi:hypothetical protein